jgi:hypothetical protein
LFVELYESGTRRHLGTDKAVSNKGMVATSGFTDRGSPHPHGWYTVEVLAYFNGPWAQPEAVLEIVGREGEFLVGRFAEPLHPEFTECERRFRAVFECVAPPLTSAAARTEHHLGEAIRLAQEAVLLVNGRKSASPVREAVQLFMSFPDLREFQGWSAAVRADGSIVVSYSFWNGDRPDTAEWSVVLDSGEVRYRNLNGKYMSWAPDD